MDFFSRGYSALRGEKGQLQSPDEIIERLADCLETATLLEDRRAGVLSLKGLVKDLPEVRYTCIFWYVFCTHLVVFILLL
jgi:hypothetical protein